MSATRKISAVLGGLLRAVPWLFLDRRRTGSACPLHHVSAQTALDAVLTTLETGEYLYYDVMPLGERTEIAVGSCYNLLHTACTVELNADVVTSVTHRTWAQRYLLFRE